MPTMPSDRRAIDALKPAAKTVVYSGGGGFALIVTANNARSLVQRYRPVPGGNPVTVTICAYDAELGPARMTLAQARQAGRDAVAKKRLPTRPQAAADAPAGINGDSTFAAMCDRYLAERRAEPNLAVGTLRNITYNVKLACAAFGDRSVSSIENADLNQFLGDILIAGKAPAMTAARSTLRCMFKWARQNVGKRVIQVELDDFRAPAPRVVSDKVLSDDELRGLATARLSSVMAGIARLQLLTGLRAIEAAELRWSEVQGDELVIAATRMKMRKEHRLPITPAIAAVLEAARARGFDGDLVFGRRSGAYKNAISKLGLGFSSHDLRRTFRTRLGELGVSDELGEALLAHTRTDSYKHHRATAAAKAEALNTWAAELDRIVCPRLALVA